jgi:hypothetical protein
MRRGLGTSDPAEADSLVIEMNQLLADESWWNATKYPEALKKFDERIAEAFYDGLQASSPESYEVRDGVISLPTKEAGYARVLFVGTTGAGKTSLLRHLIGSDPDLDRFPSTSTAKTTISDIEVIPAEGEFEAVVTFFSEAAIQTNVEDCVLNACTAVWDEQTLDKVAERFLHHPDQRFRLSYVLGSWKTAAEPVLENDDWNFGDSVQSINLLDDETVTASDSASHQQVLSSFIGRINELAKTKSTIIRKELLPNLIDATPDDREAALDIYQGELFEDESFHEIVQDVMEEALRRFDALKPENLTPRNGSSKWPLMWTYKTEDRTEFIRQIRWFSSNFAPSFGKLLTPLVDGIRVKGPLFPKFTERRIKVVLFDGQGLGHTPDSSSSVTTHITKRFADVDAILLVDNAEQPIQAAAQSVLRAVASSGNYDKLAIAFTHFDQVKGLNLPTFADKRAHVLASVHNSLSKLKEALNAPVVSAMERAIDKHAFMLGALDGASEKLPQGVRSQLDSLFNFFENAIKPPVVPDAKPTYDLSGLGFAIQRAADSFQKSWAARLGRANKVNISAENWTRVKALNRRISNELDVEYDSLRPVADFVNLISDEVSKFLDNPISWSRIPSDDSEKQAAISPIRRTIYSDLHKVAKPRLTSDRLPEWRQALHYKGTGSTRSRAATIQEIYGRAMPVPGIVNSPIEIEFMRSIREIISNAIKVHGGRLQE